MIDRSPTDTWTRTTSALSELYMMQCIEGDQCWGSTLGTYISRIPCNTLALTRDKPYVANDNNECDATVQRYSTNVRRWTYVPKDPSSVLRALVHNPVIIGIGAGANTQLYKAGVFPCGADSVFRVNHAVAVVGFQSNQLVGAARMSVWTAKNSWGTEWGERGYLRMRMDCTGGGSLLMYKHQSIVPIKGSF